jgi:dipeptidyl aminopeptidase/acylaminoacyl peptidase
VLLNQFGALTEKKLRLVVGDKTQIFSLSMEGGEAMQITKYKYGASNPKWSPDGSKILLTFL